MSLAQCRVKHCGAVDSGHFTFLLAILPAMSLATAIIGSNKIDLWKDFLFPIGYLTTLYLVWSGEPWFRYLTAAAYFSKGIPILFWICMVIAGVIASTPSEQMGAGWRVFSTAILPGLTVYFAMAMLDWAFAATLFSRLVRHFLAYQYVTEGGLANCLWRWWNWMEESLGRRKELDLKELGSPSIRRPMLTVDSIYAIDEFDLTSAVFNLIRAKRELQGPDNDDELLPTLNPGMQMVFATWWLEAEVNNGGFHQFFWNKSPSMAFAAAEGYRLIGATPHLALTLRAIEA
jgi:hypothetical protein